MLPFKGKNKIDAPNREVSLKQQPENPQLDAVALRLEGRSSVAKRRATTNVGSLLPECFVTSDMPAGNGEGEDPAVRQAKEHLARLAQEQKKLRGQQRAEQAKKSSDFYFSEMDRWRFEKPNMERKYDLEYFSTRQWLKKNYPMLDYETYIARRNKVREEARSRLATESANDLAMQQASNQIDRERVQQWEALKALASGDSGEAAKAKAALHCGASRRGWPFVAPAGSPDPLCPQGDWDMRCTKELVKQCQPGNAQRDLSAWFIRKLVGDCQTDGNYASNEVRVAALPGLHALTIADQGHAPPLTVEQYRFIVKFNFSNWKDNSNKREPYQEALLGILACANDPTCVVWLEEVAGDAPENGYPRLRKATQDLIASNRPSIQKLWDDQVPNPLLTSKERADAVARSYNEFQRQRNNIQKYYGAEPVVEAIVEYYKVPGATEIYTITDKNDPGIAVLDKILDCDLRRVRLAAAKVIGLSKLDLNHPTRFKAAKVLIDILLDPDAEPAYKRQAAALLDEALIGHKRLKIGDCTLIKRDQRLWGVTNDYLCVWNADGQMYWKPKDMRIDVEGKSATLRVDLNSIKAIYAEGGVVVSREAKLDEDENIYEMAWEERGQHSPRKFVARRQKEGGKYTNVWTLTLPPDEDDPNEKNRLSGDITIVGEFTMTMEGICTYTGEDWRKPRRKSEFTLNMRHDVRAKAPEFSTDKSK
jgi:hypothetical protein